MNNRRMKDKETSFLSAVIFIGIQASGKSTFYQQRFQETHIHINLDSLHTRNKERILIEECFQLHCSFVVDNTNPTILDRKGYLDLAREHNYNRVGYYFQSVLSDCIERNQQRSGKACIPVNGIAATSKKLELPAFEEGFDQLYYVQIIDGHFYVEEWSD